MTKREYELIRRRLLGKPPPPYTIKELALLLKRRFRRMKAPPIPAVRGHVQKDWTLSHNSLITRAVKEAGLPWQKWFPPWRQGKPAGVRTQIPVKIYMYAQDLLIKNKQSYRGLL